MWNESRRNGGREDKNFAVNPYAKKKRKEKISASLVSNHNGNGEEKKKKNETGIIMYGTLLVSQQLGLFIMCCVYIFILRNFSSDVVFILKIKRV